MSLPKVTSVWNILATSLKIMFFYPFYYTPLFYDQFSPPLLWIFFEPPEGYAWLSFETYPPGRHQKLHVSIFLAKLSLSSSINSCCKWHTDKPQYIFLGICLCYFRVGWKPSTFGNPLMPLIYYVRVCLESIRTHKALLASSFQFYLVSTQAIFDVGLYILLYIA